MVKRFRSFSDGEHEREWLALTMLDRYCPGLAPKPLTADLTALPPTVSTARLPGTPLRGSVVGDEQITELAEALTAMHGSVPAPAAARLPRRLWNEHQAAAGVHARHERLLQVNAPPEIRQAAAEGMRRLRPAGPGSTPEADVPPVFGQADGYLANFLRDGTSVRIVDFEDSGRSDRAYELADVVEHVST